MRKKTKDSATLKAASYFHAVLCENRLRLETGSQPRFIFTLGLYLNYALFVYSCPRLKEANIIFRHRGFFMLLRTEFKRAGKFHRLVDE